MLDLIIGYQNGRVASVRPLRGGVCAGVCVQELKKKKKGKKASIENKNTRKIN